MTRSQRETTRRGTTVALTAVVVSIAIAALVAPARAAAAGVDAAGPTTKAAPQLFLDPASGQPPDPGSGPQPSPTPSPAPSPSSSPANPTSDPAAGSGPAEAAPADKDNIARAGSGGDAEPAPGTTPPPSTSSPTPTPANTSTPTTTAALSDARASRPGPRHRIAVVPRFAYRLGDAGRAVSPAPGFGIGGSYAFRYATIGPALEAALGIEFAFDRFATSEQGMVIASDGSTETFGSTRVITETSFLLAHTIAAHAGPLRPWVTVGAGLGIGYFNSASLDLRPGTASEAHLLGRAAVGLDLAIGETWSATIRGGFTAVRHTTPLVTEMGQALPLFGDLFDVGLGLAYGF